MDRTLVRRIVGVAMVTLGLLQATFGVTSGDPFYATFGFAYALIGAVYLWYEGYVTVR